MAAGHALVIWVALGGGSRRGPRKRLRCNEGYAVTRANTTGDNRRYVPCFLPLHRGAEGGSFSHGTRAHACIELGPASRSLGSPLPAPGPEVQSTSRLSYFSPPSYTAK